MHKFVQGREFTEHGSNRECHWVYGASSCYRGPRHGKRAGCTRSNLNHRELYKHRPPRCIAMICPAEQNSYNYIPAPSVLFDTTWAHSLEKIASGLELKFLSTGGPFIIKHSHSSGMAPRRKESSGWKRIHPSNTFGGSQKQIQRETIISNK